MNIFCCRFHVCGVDMRQTDDKGRTALHLAASAGMSDSAEFLIKTCKVPVDHVDV